MPEIVAFRFPLANGLHARPASALEGAVRRWRAEVSFINRRNGRRADGRSVLALIGTETRDGDECELRIEGGDALEAAAELRRFLAEVLPGSDPQLPAVETAPAGAGRLPRSLEAAGLGTHFFGQAACEGIGEGAIVRDVPLAAGAAAGGAGLRLGSAADELARFREGFQGLVADLRSEREGASGAAAQVLEAHLAMLRDPALGRAIEARIEAGLGAAAAAAAGVEEAGAPLRAAASALLRERLLDLEDLGARLMERLGLGPAPVPQLEGPSVVAAMTLAPSRFLRLDRSRLQGLILGATGATSHTAILARSFGIPTVTGLAAAMPHLGQGTPAIVDGRLGLVVAEPSDGVRRYYRRQRLHHEKLRLRAAAQTSAAPRPIEIGANLATAEEADLAFAEGADGIGLFRTEMLFLDRASPPGEEEQFEIYRRVVAAAAGRPVIVRTLDIGGDKRAAFLGLPREANPFLGVRGVRWYGREPDIVKTQFRALARAAAEGPLRVMVPMIAQPEEFALCRRLLDEALGELKDRGAKHAPRIELGAMLEVPAALFAMEELCRAAEFFSIGTNDLAQYLFAADRDNPALADPHRCLQPAFLRAVRALAATARLGGRWIGLCGEWAEDAAALPLLVGFGLHEISVPARRVAELKLLAGRLERGACEALAGRAAKAGSADEVMALLGEFAVGAPIAGRAADGAASAGLVGPELVLLDSDSRTKEEAIREMADALHLAGRTGDPQAVEAAIWAREAVTSTDVGHGFALPHCKSEAVAVSSLVLLRPRQPLGWGAEGGEPVGLAALLALRPDEHGRRHLASMARFSRLMMREGFRARLESDDSPERLAAFLDESLQA